MSGPTDLLRRLGGVGASQVAREAPATPVSGAGFDELLRRARVGDLSSERPISIASSVELDLSAEQLGRVAAAADRAEAAGASTVLVLMDGVALKLDVLTRTVTQKVDMADAAVITGIDAVVSASGGSRAAPLGPPSAFGNAALAGALGTGGNDERE